MTAKENQQKEEDEEGQRNKSNLKSGLFGAGAFLAGFAASSSLVNNLIPAQKVEEKITEKQNEVEICPFEEIPFRRFEDYKAHFTEQHKGQKLIMNPLTREVENPRYEEIIPNSERKDQKNTVLSRSVWDEDFRDQLKEAANISSKPNGDWREFTELSKENEHNGGLYTDKKVGNWDLKDQYIGYEGHLKNGGGLWGWKAPVGDHKIRMDPEIASSNIKRTAELYGADLVGITKLNEKCIYSNYYERSTEKSGKLSTKGEPAPENETNISYDHAIVMAIKMDWETIKTSPSWEITTESAVSHSQLAKVASRLAAYIRALGYAAVPSGNDTTQSIPLAIDAGLGQLGRNGLLITPELGARQRIAKVYTNLPLEEDKPIDFGLQEYCDVCEECINECPANAINEGKMDSIDIDYESCLENWVKEGRICANCIKACPWSNPEFNRENYGYKNEDQE